MKKNLYVLLFLALSIMAFSQRQTQYNIDGDEAMKRLDYYEALIWFEEGIDVCNMHSINQLTEIWLVDTSMRISMHNVMGRCLACLNDRATETKDTASIYKLILYYTEGIGTSIDQQAADFWRDQLESVTNLYIEKEGEGQPSVKKERNKMEFFVGYSFNVLAPVGLKTGVVGKSVGGYVRFNTNLSNQKYTGICDGLGYVIGLSDVGYSWSGHKKTNATMITGGLIFKPAQAFLISAGAGYWKRDLIYDYEKTNLTETRSEGIFWAKCEDFSYEGLAIDLDGTCRIGKTFYVSTGCSFLNSNALNFKVYGNAGIGVFF
jgi:hypothetical protein